MIHRILMIFNSNSILYCYLRFSIRQEQQEGKRKLSLSTSPSLVMATSLCSR